MIFKSSIPQSMATLSQPFAKTQFVTKNSEKFKPNSHIGNGTLYILLKRNNIYSTQGGPYGPQNKGTGGLKSIHFFQQRGEITSKPLYKNILGMVG